MDTVLLNNNIQLTQSEFLSYFSCELLLLIGIVLNLFFFLFRKRKEKFKRLSDVVTSGILSLNVFITLGLLSKSFFNSDVSFSFLKDLFIYNNQALAFKFAIYSIGLLFSLVVYRLIRKLRVKNILLNTILLLLLLFSSFLMCANAFISTFLLYEAVLFLVYKYGSNMRIRKSDLFNRNFFLVSICATILFLIFYLPSFFIKDEFQLNIINSCLAFVILMKIGIFPIYNYILDEQHKTNIPFSALLSCYLPFVGVITFLKLSQGFDLYDEIFQISVSVFLLVSFIYFILRIFKIKNLTKFLCITAYCFLVFSIINILFLGRFEYSIGLMYSVSLCLLGLYSLTVILKLNLDVDKIKFSTLKGVFFNNRLFAFLFSCLLLALANIIPTKITANTLAILKNAYIFDAVGFYAIICSVVAGLIIMYNSFVVIKNLYSFDKSVIFEKLTKRTTLNYVVPIVIIVFLILNLFL